MAQLDKKQVKHMLTLIELAILYVADCLGCTESDCPLNVEIKEHTSDLPDLPPGLKICSLFDYISQNSYRKN